MKIDDPKQPFNCDCIELMKLPKSEGGGNVSQKQAEKIAAMMNRRLKKQKK
jgi:hypothetical protein